MTMAMLWIVFMVLTERWNKWHVIVVQQNAGNACFRSWVICKILKLSRCFLPDKWRPMFCFHQMMRYFCGVCKQSKSHSDLIDGELVNRSRGKWEMRKRDWQYLNWKQEQDVLGLTDGFNAVKKKKKKLVLWYFNSIFWFVNASL